MSALACSSFPPGRMPCTGARAVSLAASATSRQVEPRNASAWHQIGEFLDAQWLASLGCRMIAHGAASTELATAKAAPVVLRLAK